MHTHNQTLLELFQELSSLTNLKNHYLAGGTNLAFRFNHRTSIDLDFFQFKEPDISESNEISRHLKHVYENEVDTTISRVGAFARIKEIKVNIVNYPYPLFKDIEEIKGGIFASCLDISAMKINAIIGRGSRKDFFDVHFLLNHLSLKEMIDAYKTKYNIDQSIQAKMSLTYFEDAENKTSQHNQYQPLNYNPGWGKIKKDITLAVRSTFQ